MRDKKASQLMNDTIIFSQSTQHFFFTEKRRINKQLDNFLKLNKNVQFQLAHLESGKLEKIQGRPKL